MSVPVVSATLTTVLPFARARSSAASASIAWFSETTLATRDTSWPWAHAWASDASVVGSGCTATLVAVGRTQDLLILDGMRSGTVYLSVSPNGPG